LHDSLTIEPQPTFAERPHERERHLLRVGPYRRFIRGVVANDCSEEALARARGVDRKSADHYIEAAETVFKPFPSAAATGLPAGQRLRAP
jgi:hypothetical protein